MFPGEQRRTAVAFLRTWTSLITAMTERERWIVYPLVFFALGAALRDKFLQHVSTKEIECQRLIAKQIECEGGIICEGVIVLNPENRSQRLVEMGPAAPATGSQGDPSQRLGLLILRDSSGQELCGVSNNELFVRKINCEGLAVVDPDNPTRPPLAALTSAAPRAADPEDQPKRFGVLALNNQAFWQLVGLPPLAPNSNSPDGVDPQSDSEDDENAPADDSAGEDPT
jgi:hypothetical protein